MNEELSLHGVWVPVVTPFEGDAAALDLAALRALVQRCVAAGVAGFVACGSTGEAAALSDDETAAVLTTVKGAAGGKPVLLGLAGSQRASMIERVQRHAAQASGFLVSPPAYVRPSQAGVQDWFVAIADASPKPVLLYDIPYRTGVRIECDTALALAAHPRIVGIKDCGGDAAATQRLIADGRLAVLAGEDAQLFGALCLGAAGGIVASAQAWPHTLVGLFDALRAQRLHDAREIAHRLAEPTRLLFAQPNPAPLKGLLARRGDLQNLLRAPLRPADDALVEALVKAQAGLA